MGFLSPDVPKPPPLPNPAINPTVTKPQPRMGDFGSLITSSPAGLKRKTDLNKVSLIGGG